jgi:hypothetical protein
MAPVVASRPKVRLSPDRGMSYPWVHGLDATWPPKLPAAVYTYDIERQTTCLAVDFDVRLAGGEEPGRRQVTSDCAALFRLIENCGGWPIVDRGADGGLHLYLPLAPSRSHEDVVAVVRGLAGRYATLDPGPMLNADTGCIGPPGALGKRGRPRELLTPLGTAKTHAANPAGDAVWARLTHALAADIRRAESALRVARAPFDGEVASSLPLPGGRRRLHPKIEQIARFGRTRGYPSPSEARQGFVAAAYLSGLSMADIDARMASGEWAGLDSLYRKYGGPERRKRRLVAEWNKAAKWAAEGFPARVKAQVKAHEAHSLSTSQQQSFTRPGGVSGSSRDQEIDPRELAALRFAREFMTAVRAATRDGTYNGPSAASTLLVLRALAAAAHIRRTRHVAWGIRSLAIAAGVSHATVGAVLRRLREEPDGFVDLVRAGEGLEADLYELRIPDRYARIAERRSWPAGRLGVPGIVRVLGPAAALCLEALELDGGGDPMQLGAIAAAAGGIDPRTARAALTDLRNYGLAQSTPGGWWRRGLAATDDVERILGVDDLIGDIRARYKDERARWKARHGVLPVDDPKTDPVFPDVPRGQDHPEQPPDSRSEWDDTEASPAAADTEAAVELVTVALGAEPLERAGAPP